jgi:hypothetical protein
MTALPTMKKRHVDVVALLKRAVGSPRHRSPSRSIPSALPHRSHLTLKEYS